MKPFLPAFLSCAKRSTMRFMRGESLVCRWLVASCKLADALEWAHLPSPQRLRLLDTATAGPRTVPVRSSIAGGKAQECSRPPRPSDVLRAETARAGGSVKIRPHARAQENLPLTVRSQKQEVATCS